MRDDSNLAFIIVPVIRIVRGFRRGACDGAFDADASPSTTTGCDVGFPVMGSMHHHAVVGVLIAARVDPSEWGWFEILLAVVAFSRSVWITLALIVGIWALQRLAQWVLGGRDDEPIDYDRL
jgi:hypothetical protein